ncbi:MAG: DUF4159 domain-containing protein [Paracoccaceae bacterium]|nr:DUF4159 domain-containing protein [Paracoccaceae bacterium]
MFTLGALGFVNPWLLSGLIALPVLWWLLRAIPPSPKILAFPGVRLLLGLEDPERQAAKTPWWLLLLRCLALAAVIIGFAGPVLNPSARLVPAGEGPVLILMDQGWASAPDWRARKAAALAAVDEAAREGRQVILWLAAEGRVPTPVPAEAARAALEATRPAPWAPDHSHVLDALNSDTLPDPAQTIWFHDGLSHGEATGQLAIRLAGLGPLRLVGPQTAAKALTPPTLDDGRMVADVLRADSAGAGTASVIAFSGGPGEPERRLGIASVEFGPGSDKGEARFDLPPELLGRVSRLALTEGASAGGTAMAGAGLSPISAAVIDPVQETVVAALTSPAHFLGQALVPWANVKTASLEQVLGDPPGVIVLADQGDFTDQERAGLIAWVEGGGLLIRFAGPRLAAAVGEGGLGAGAVAEDDLLPVRLRRGGRVLGGALAWGAPKTLGPFDPNGPFRRLTPPAEVGVRTQVLAEPSPDLAGKVWAVLDDGTPMVTANKLGQGHVVLFHVSADSDWSSLPLSGLFVEMLGALMTLAPGRTPEPPTAEELAGTLWRGALMIGADGVPVPGSDLGEPVPGERLAVPEPGRDLPPGLYRRADSAARAVGSAESMVVNLFTAVDTLAPFPPAPSGAVVETLGGVEARKFGAELIALAVILGAIDLLATLWLSGRLTGHLRSGRTRAAAGALAALALAAPSAEAQDVDGSRAVAATAETTLGYVMTGDARIDRVSERGMVGLGYALARRTAVEPGPPMGVDPEVDELSLFPVLYWPLDATALPSEDALQRLARYLTGGGMLVIDTQGGGSGANRASGPQMRQIARALNLPPLAPVDQDHVLGRSFYLLAAFPGRWRGGSVWAEAPPPGTEQRVGESGLPQFDRVDDNVSPVIVGSADWASAWATDERGAPMFPIGRSGDNQREMAIRFGINLVMYALTGNYKSDQVHAPAVLERLGQ